MHAKDKKTGISKKYSAGGGGVPGKDHCLDTLELSRLEDSFREWAEKAVRKDVRLSRRRILLIFLIIRYTGGKLSEVLALDPFTEIDPERQEIVFYAAANRGCSRRIRISSVLAREIREVLSDPDFKDFLSPGFRVDPGFVRRKFYERAEECGLSPRLGGPEMIRAARSRELMQGSLPLPVVQKILGQSAPGPASAFASFSEQDIQQVTHAFMEREAQRKTSARNTFFGKIAFIERGDVQSRVEIVTIGGQQVVAVITNLSADRLGLRKGSVITAEVKAPWVFLEKGEREPESSAENRFSGVVEHRLKGRVNTEYVLRITDGTLLSAIVSTGSARILGLEPGDRVWAAFNCFAVTLHAD